MDGSGSKEGRNIETLSLSNPVKAFCVDAWHKVCFATVGIKLL